MVRMNTNGRNRVALYAAWYFGSIPKAAARLGYRSSSTLYWTLYAYEKLLGEPLWVRKTGKEMRLTAVGEMQIAPYRNLHKTFTAVGIVGWMRLVIRRHYE